MTSHYNLGKKCQKCKKPIVNHSKFGFCNHCRDRNGKNNPFYGKSHSREMIENIKKKLSSISKQKWNDQEYREKVIKGVTKPRREGFKAEQSQRIKRWYIDNPEQRVIRSKIMAKSWADGRIELNINSINESKLEIEFREKLKKILINRSVRKSTIKINNRWFYPDIIIDSNIIIEFYGNYWHANPRIFKPDDIVHHKLMAKQIWENDKNRIMTLENKFKVFIVWQDEYQGNKEKIINNLINQL